MGGSAIDDDLPGSFEARLESWLNRPLHMGLLLLLLIAIGLINALPHMSEAIWQDEAATLFFHVSRGIVDPFQHYMSANSHIGFTSMLAAWLEFFPSGAGIIELRLLPLALFLAAIPVVYFAARRIGGAACAIISSLAFSASAVTSNFATQLRGYGPSWIFFSSLLLCATNIFSRQHSVAWRLGYVGSCLLAVSILPTNVFFAALTAAATCVYHWADGVRFDRKSAPGYLLLLLSPGAALLVAYSAVWAELMSYRNIGFSTWTMAGLLENWLLGTWASFGLIVILAAAGLLFGLRDTLRSALDKKQVSPNLLLAFGLVTGLAPAIWVIPSLPFPRTLVPYFPVWVIALSYLALYGLRVIMQQRSSGSLAYAFTFFLLPAWAFSPLAGCRSDSGARGAFDYDLCYQYFRDDYHPARILDAWATTEPRGLPIVTDFEGYFALKVLQSPADVSEYRNYQPFGKPAPLLVAHGKPELDRMATQLGLSPSAYVLIVDTGYFKMYGPAAPP